MIRIEILFDRQSTKNLKSGTLQALQNEIEQRLKPHYPESAGLAVRQKTCGYHRYSPVNQTCIFYAGTRRS